MEFFHQLIDMLLHLDPSHVNQFALFCGPWLYIVLFFIVFCETGFVVTPFLPGDSLLFALGAVAAMPGSQISLPLIIILLCLAANLGDAFNYFLGYRIGPKVFSKEGSRLLNKKHLREAQNFYEKHGRKTIIIARFVPIIRTFAPFVAGIGRMNFLRFAIFSITGGAFWVMLLTILGKCSMDLAKYVGGQDKVEKNFKFIIAAIIVISVLPAVIHFIQARRAPHTPEPQPQEQKTL